MPVLQQWARRLRLSGATLADSTGPMRTEAVKVGFYETLYGKYPRIQILTIKELFEGKQPNIPLVAVRIQESTQRKSRRLGRAPLLKRHKRDV
jgi:hypothetical protein